ncbi:MAG: ankyrin repeat domain-containing protein [Acidobacteriia bacterium]|nr:ankyrin repeat domain-containing protein [Terriglobia bacterium]
MKRLAGLVLGFAMAVFAADVNDDLLNAARKGDLAAVKALCEKGAAIEAKTQYGQTPLYLASMNGHDDVVRFLLDKGAVTDVKDTFYKASILDFVVQRKHYEVAKMLIAKGTGSPDDELAAVADSENPDLVQAVLAKGKVSQPALDKTYEMALDQKQRVIADLLKKAGAHEPAPPVVVDPKVLESYAGTYKTDQLPFDIKVFVKDGKLYLQATGQPEFAPKPKSPTSFEYAQFQLQVDFDSATSFTVKQGGRESKFKKAVAQ